MLMNNQKFQQEVVEVGSKDNNDETYDKVWSNDRRLWKTKNGQGIKWKLSGDVTTFNTTSKK